MKYQFIRQYSSVHCVQKMCRVLKVSRSGFYRWLTAKESRYTRENREILAEIRNLHAKPAMSSYGSPRMAAELNDRGFVCSVPRVARIMKAHHIRSTIKPRFKTTTHSDHKKEKSPNLLQQNFSSPLPNRHWVSDITYIWTFQGWLYLTIVLDLFHRKIVGWAMSDRLSTDVTTIAALEQAYQRERPEPGLIFHSDPGSQYASDKFRALLSKYQMVQSMSGKGNCYDNAVAESFFKTVKTELIWQNSCKTREETKRNLFEYIECHYNRNRKHSYLGYLSPEDFLLRTQIKLNQAIT